MQGKEAGSIIGKKGDNIKRFRETSGAKINVSDSSCPDRIVTLSGMLDEVYNALSMICSKLEEQSLKVNSGSLNIKPASSFSNSGTRHSLLLGNPAPSVIDPLFGLPSAAIVSNDLKESSLASVKKDADMLTINNNSTSAVNNNTNTNNNNSSSNNNTLSAPNKNLTSNTLDNNSSIDSAYHPTVTLRLIIPASQCGSLIGRGGAKIKEIREMTSAAIQVAPDVLPNSTERVVTISGSVESLRKCAYQICIIMLESPPKGYTIPYRPKPAITPMILAAAASAGQAAAAYNLPGQFLSTHCPDVSRLFAPNNQLFNQTALNLRAAATGQAAAALSAVASQSMSSHEMVIPNGLIGCVIGKGGSKINEIRQLSGATIKISNSEEGTKNRTITISGSPDAISLAQYLITARYVSFRCDQFDLK